MAFRLLTKIFGSRNDRQLRRFRSAVARINALEPDLEKLDDAQLQAKTAQFQQQIAAGKSLDEVLPEAFAVVREGSRRTMNMRHFDVQLLGAMALHNGRIAEMRTGEGKTLTATLAVYLNALSGKGVHVVTVNDYLAQRDAEWMGRLYSFLGLSVGVILSGQDRSAKQAAYQADITYGTNNEYGFDYLRDNMVYEVEDRVQRPLNYAIVDEVDSILIDEARTPLIISGQAEDHAALYLAMNAIAPQLSKQEGEADPRTGEGVRVPGDYVVDEKSHQVYLTEAGHERAEELLGHVGLIAPGSTLYDVGNIALLHHLYAALRAHTLYQRDRHYVVQSGENGLEVVIVDEFTGRLMAGRRWSDGLHQAVEAKEGVTIQAENQTMASITFQNYFRLYQKLAGMTGTADTEAYEFEHIYGLETMVIPPNKPNRRQDQQDRIYKSTEERYEAALADITECYQRGQPVLVGTSSIENSELIAELLKTAKLPHQVLNAKQHAREAQIIVQAGRPNMITIATNMAGRGTDIVLGGNLEKMLLAVEQDAQLEHHKREQKLQEVAAQWRSDHERVKALGGLRIIATERHESRRIDNQLRGRAGRQGDPGSSRFYLSLDDPLLRIFAGDRVRAIMERLKMPRGEAIEAGIVTRSIENAQRKVEARNFDIRKQLLEYDDVANEQRKIVYLQRNSILDSTDNTEQVALLREGTFVQVVQDYVPADSVEEQWDVPGLENVLRQEWQLPLDIQSWLQTDKHLDCGTLQERVIADANRAYLAKIELVGKDNFGRFERMVLLQSLDNHWREHLSNLDHLRQGIHLRGYAQKQPKQEYAREAFGLFARMLDAVKMEVTRILMTVHIQTQEEALAAAAVAEAQAEHIHNLQLSAPDEMGQAQVTPLIFTEEGIAMVNQKEPTHRGFPVVGRNQLCPCGSGKKYKHCHGAVAKGRGASA